MQTKHTSQSDADTGLPILMPYSQAADGRFPWRWGQHNLSPGKWQRVDTTTSWLSGSEQQAGNWDSYQPVHIQSKGTYRSSGPSASRIWNVKDTASSCSSFLVPAQPKR